MVVHTLSRGLAPAALAVTIDGMVRNAQALDFGNLLQRAFTWAFHLSGWGT